MDANDKVLERLARMEEQLKQIHGIKGSIDTLNAALASLNQVYLTRAESTAFNLAREQQLKNLEEKLTNQDKRITKIENGVGWFLKIVGGILIAALLGLVIVQGGK